jgi:serine/threonine-protein kinase
MSVHITQPRVASRLVELEPGAHVGSYTIERKLAEGGMAVVYEATHRVLPRRTALKVMRDASLGEPARTRVLREACVLAELHHRAIVDVHDAGTLPDGRAWLVMNLVDGCTLAAHLASRITLAPYEVAEIVRHLAGALSTAHDAGIVHRDLKPENIILVDDPACPVRIVDWGIAQATREGDARLTLDGSITGTPHYMAPEQIRGHVVDGKCDVYALGILAYELVTGTTPFNGTVMDVVAHHLTTMPRPLHLQAPATPVWLSALVMSMIAKSPDLRPTMAEVVAEHAKIPEESVVVEMIADMEEDEVDREVDELIAELPLRPLRFAYGSNA